MIYMAKVSLLAQSQDDMQDTNKMQVIKGQSARVSAMYGVTSRTIRDIWNRQSWAYATRHLWCLEPQLGSEDVKSMPILKVLFLSLQGAVSEVGMLFIDLFLVALCSKIYIQTIAVQDGQRDLATGFHEKKMRNMMRRSGTLIHR